MDRRLIVAVAGALLAILLLAGAAAAQETAPFHPNSHHSLGTMQDMPFPSVWLPDGTPDKAQALQRSFSSAGITAGPVYTVSLTYDEVMGTGAVANRMLEFRLKEGTTVKGRGLARTDSVGYFADAQLYDNDGRLAVIAPGDTLEIDDGLAHAGGVITIEIPDLSATVNPEIDTVAGQITGVALPADVLVGVAVGMSQMIAASDDAGNFAVDFSGTLDISWEDLCCVTVSHEDANGNWVSVRAMPDRPGLTVYKSNDELFGFADPGETVSVTVSDDSALLTVKMSGTAEADEYGDWHFSGDESIDPGDTVEVQVGGQTLTSTVAGLTADIGLGTSNVTGTGPANSQVRALIYRREGTGVRWWAQSVPTDANGDYTATFPGLTFNRWDRVQVYHHDTTRADTHIYRRAPAANVNVTYDNIYGGAEPGADVDVTLRDGGGGVKEAGTATAKPDGYYQYNFNADVETGDTVEVSGGGIATTIPVQNLTTALDLTADTLSGVAPVSSPMIVSGWGAGPFFEHTLSSDANGDYSLDLNGQVDLHNGGQGHVYYAQADDHKVFLHYRTPVFYIDINYAGLMGYVPVPHAPVTIRVEDSEGAEKWRGDFTAGKDDWLGMWRFETDGEVIDLLPGDRVIVTWSEPAETSEVSKDLGGLTGLLQAGSQTVEIPDLWADEIDVQNDVVRGHGPPNSLIEVYAEGPWRLVPTDDDGNFVVDFSDLVDIQPGAGVSIGWYDGNWNEPYRWQQAPYPWARINYTHDWVDGQAQLDAEIDVSVWRGGAEIGSASTTSGASGWFGSEVFDGEGRHLDIVPGDQVRVTGGGLDETIDVITIEGKLDPDAETVSGQMFGGVFPALGRVEVWDKENRADMDVELDAAGRYEADFSGRYDVNPDTQAEVRYYDPNGNQVEVVFSIPFLQVRANRSHDWVQGQAPRETNVVVRVLRDGEEAGRGESHTGSGTWFHVDPENEWGGRVDIQVGDVIEVTAGELSASVEMVDMTATVDAVANTVSGQIIDVPYPADVRVEVWGEHGDSWKIQTDEAGNFSLNFSDYDVRSGDDVAVWYVRPDGHMPGIVRSHLRLETDITDDDLWGQTTPGARVDLTLSTPTGLQAVKVTATTWAGDEGEFGTQFRDEDNNVVDIAPGDVISAQADGREAGLQIPSPYSAEYDHEANTVCGEAPPGQELEVNLWGYGDMYVTVEPDGTYCADLSELGDPQIEDEGQVSFHNEDGHRLVVRFRTPSPDLTLEKWGEGQPVSGRTYDWTLRYRNQGDAPAEGVALEDTLPEGMSFVSASPAPTAVIGNRAIWGLDTVAPGDWFTITLTVQVDAEPGNDVENCAEISTTVWERDPGNNGACDSLQAVANEVDLSVNKGASPGDPVPGQEYVYQINYGNGRAASALDVVISDTLPISTTVVAEWHPRAWRVDTSTPGVVAWTRPEMPGHHGGYLELKLRVNDDVGLGQQLWNRVEIATSSDDVDPNNNWHEHDVWTNEPHVNLWVNKYYQRGSPVAGQEYTYWVDLSNGGNVVAPSVVLTDDLDSGLTFVRAERFDWNPATGENDLRSPITPEAQGEHFVRFGLGNIPPWRWMGLEITARINNDVAVGSALANRVQVSSDAPDDDPGDNRAGWVFETQAPGPNLWVRKWVGDGEPCVDCDLRYDIQIVNDGTEPAFNVVISDTLPTEVEYRWNQWWGEPTIVNGTLIWALGTMEPGDNWGEEIGVHVPGDTPAGTELLNAVEVSTSSAESRYDDNAYEHRTVVGPDLRVEKELLDEPLPGYEVRYRIRIWNDSDTGVSNAVLTDFLPEEVEFRGDDWGGEFSDGQVVWNLGNLGPGWSGEFDMYVYIARDVPGGTVITNTLDIASDEDDANPDDNRFELASIVESPYRIRVQETHDWMNGQVLPDAYVNITLKDGGGAVKETINTGADGDGSFFAGFSEDIAPGDTVEVDTEGTPLIVIEVVRIEGAVNANADTISGHVYDVAYPADVRGEVWGEVWVDGQTDESGDYTVDFSPFDVKSGHTVGLWYIRPDGHQVGIQRSALFVRVYPTDDHVNGQTAPNTAVDVVLRDSEGILKGTAQVTSDENGDWDTEIYTDTQRVEIDDQDTVEVTAGVNSASVYVPWILLLPDAAHGWLAIPTELSNTQLEIRWDSEPNMEDHDLANSTEVTTDEYGVAQLDFRPLGGLGLGVHGNLYYYNEDGNCVEPWWRAMIASVAPNEFVNNTDHTVFIAGTGFQPTPEAVLLGIIGQPNIVLADVTYISDALLQVTVPAGTPAGAYYVQVPNPDERMGYLWQALTILNPEPTVTGIAPAEAPNDAPVNVVISGTNFAEGAAVSLVMDGKVINGTVVTVVSSTQLSATFDITDAAVGAYDVVVTNPGPREPTGALPDGFKVKTAVRSTFLPLMRRGM